MPTGLNSEAILAMLDDGEVEVDEDEDEDEDEDDDGLEHPEPDLESGI